MNTMQGLVRGRGQGYEKISLLSIKFESYYGNEQILVPFSVFTKS